VYDDCTQHNCTHTRSLCEVNGLRVVYSCSVLDDVHILVVMKLHQVVLLHVQQLYCSDTLQLLHVVSHCAALQHEYHTLAGCVAMQHASAMQSSERYALIAGLVLVQA
jgi:hypothetical protein